MIVSSENTGILFIFVFCYGSYFLRSIIQTGQKASKFLTKKSVRCPNWSISTRTSYQEVISFGRFKLLMTTTLKVLCIFRSYRKIELCSTSRTSPLPFSLHDPVVRAGGGGENTSGMIKMREIFAHIINEHISHGAPLHQYPDPNKKNTDHTLNFGENWEITNCLYFPSSMPRLFVLKVQHATIWILKNKIYELISCNFKKVFKQKKDLSL